MKRYVLAALLLAGGMTLPFTIGCDEKIAEEKKVEVNDGKVVKKETDVVRQPDGDIVKTEKKQVDKIDHD